MEPVIRIATFLVVAGGAASGRPAAVGAAALLVITGLILTRPAPGPVLRPLRRLKWVALALAVFYAWGSPGHLLWPALAGWSPTLEGLAEAGIRLGGLATVAVGAGLLMETTATPALVAAIAWLATPLRPLGLDRDRLALRLVLVMEWATTLRQRPLPEVRARGRVERAAELAITRLRETLEWAETGPATPWTLPATGWPPVHQWVWPLAALALMALAIPGIR
ncbi:MAG: hypothetical protein ACQERG_06260 [Pseudomonadota bacterium]